MKAISDTGQQSISVVNRAPRLNVCITRWVENIDGWERFTLAHPFLVTLCEAIIYGNDDYLAFNKWSAEDKCSAMPHLKFLKSFQFVYALVTLETLKRTLLCLREPAVPF